MDSFLYTINEQNKSALDKPHDSNRIYYSELHEWHTQNAFRSFSIKYALAGTIYYKIDNREYTVTEGSFLVADKRDAVTAGFESLSVTKSICIDINTDILTEAAALIKAKENFDFDNYLANYFTDSFYCEQVYSTKENLVGRKLMQLAKLISYVTEPDLTDEWFMELAELILLQEKGNFLELDNIKSVKASTRKEILCRLKIAKAYMDEFFLVNPELKEIARHCNMSEFHFFKTFKQAFGITPYKYLLYKRVEFSKKLLLQKKAAVEIADTCGFSGLVAYSKAFKRITGISPSGYCQYVS